MKLKYQTKRQYVDGFFYDGTNLHSLMDFIEEFEPHNSHVLAWEPTEADFYVTYGKTKERLKDGVYVVRTKEGTFEQLDKTAFEDRYEPVR